MRREDFEQSTPEEFYAICKAWDTESQSLNHERWEMMRLHATITVQPHVKKRLNPRKLLRLPWETDGPKEANRRKMSAAERRARFERLTEKLKRDVEQ